MAFDPDVLLRLLDGDREAADEIMAEYAADAPRQVVALREALEAGDADATRRHAHTLKGASANVGAEALRAAAYEVEKAGADGDLDAARELAGRVDDELKRLQDHLAGEMHGHEGAHRRGRPTSRVLLKKVLEKWGYEVVVTTNGAEAWEGLQVADAPHLAILDWMMPEMDGVEVCRRARALETRQPPYLILLTALGEKDHMMTAFSAGAG